MILKNKPGTGSMKASIITIGNELLIGDTINTNAAWIGNYLTEAGFSVENVLTIPDDYHIILQSIKHSLESSGLIVMTGGLGPTHDDVTKKAVADLFDSQLVLDEKVLHHIEETFRRRGIPFNKSVHEQALVPDKSRVLFNERGTAPGLWVHRENASVAVFPGVPHEMKWLMENPFKKVIDETFGKPGGLTTKYIQTSGVGESTLSDDVIGDLEGFLQNGNQIAYLPGYSGVTLRVSVRNPAGEEPGSLLQPLVDHIYQKAGEYIIGEGRDVTIEQVTGQCLREKNLTISTAESCTGGLLSSRITDVPGSGDYAMGGMVVYANSMKTSLLNVPEKIIQNSGAVSRETALILAKNVAKTFGSDIGVSTTGLAGPGGGREGKPVGLVWMGFYLPGAHFALRAQLAKDRLLNKELTVSIVLETVRRQLLGISPSYPYGLQAYFP